MGDRDTTAVSPVAPKKAKPSRKVEEAPTPEPAPTDVVDATSYPPFNQEVTDSPE